MAGPAPITRRGLGRVGERPHGQARSDEVFQLSTGGSYYRLGNYNEMATTPLSVCESQNTTLDVFPVYAAYDKELNQLGTGQAATITNP